MLHLSQGLLNLFSSCPRKFQHIYLDQLNEPIVPAQQERLNWGSRFHLLMQQQELGLPFNALKSFDPAEQQIREVVDTFIQLVPELFHICATTFRHSEHQRSLSLQGYLLTVIYDLLILDEQQAQILDWKTYARPQTADGLSQNWQTRLYPFVLAETTDYLPQQISVTYWFVQSQEETLKPQCLRLPYSQAQHQQTYQDLTNLLNQMTESIQRYQLNSEPFSQVEIAEVCETCAFMRRCQRESPRSNDRPRSVVTLKEIPEIWL